MNVNRIFITSVFAPIVALFLVSCSESDKSYSAPLKMQQLPNIDGISLLRPEFNTQRIKEIITDEESKDTAAEQMKNSINTELEKLEKNKKMISETQKQIDEISKQKVTLVEKIETLSKSEPPQPNNDTKDTLQIGLIYKQKMETIAVENSDINKKISSLNQNLDQIDFFKQLFTKDDNLIKKEIETLRAKQNSNIKIQNELTKSFKSSNIDTERELALRMQPVLQMKRMQENEILNSKSLLQKLDENMNRKNEYLRNLQAESRNIEESIRILTDESKKLPRSLVLQFNEMKLNLINKFNNKELVDSKSIIDAIILKQSLMRTDSVHTYTTIKSLIEAVAERASTSSIDQFKIGYENILVRDIHKEKKLVYNREATSIADPFIYNKVQDDSGTLLFLVFNELQENPFNNTLVILTDGGHIQPGYVSHSGVNLNLYGIETTADGKALVDYGPTQTIKGNIFVFDAHQFLFLELFKEDLNNVDTLLSAMIKTTDLYGFNSQNLKPTDSINLNIDTQNLLKSSILSFGQLNAVPGDQIRQTFEQKINYEFQN